MPDDPEGILIKYFTCRIYLINSPLVKIMNLPNMIAGANQDQGIRLPTNKVNFLSSIAFSYIMAPIEKFDNAICQSLPPSAFH